MPSVLPPPQATSSPFPVWFNFLTNGYPPNSPRFVPQPTASGPAAATTPGNCSLMTSDLSSRLALLQVTGSSFLPFGNSHTLSFRDVWCFLPPPAP